MNKKDAHLKRKVSLTLILSVAAMFVNYAIMFFLTPFITENMGAEAYGFVTLAKTIANYGIIITSALNSFSARYISISYNQGDLKKTNVFFSSVVIANLVLLGATIVFDLFFVLFIEFFINIPDEMLLDVKILFFLDIANYMLLALAGSFNAYAYIKNRLENVQINRIISCSSEALILFVLFMTAGLRIFYVGVALIVSSLVLLILNIRNSKRYIPELRVSRHYFSKEAVKKLLISGMWSSINNVGNMLNTGLDLLVSNLLLSAVAMGELSVVKTVSVIFTTIAQLLCNPFHPQLLKYYAQKDIKAVVSLLSRQIRFSGYFVSVITAIFISIGQSYFALWTPKQNTELLYYIGVVTVLGFLFEGIAYPLFYTYTLTLKNRIPCIVTICSGVLNVAGMFILLKFTSAGLYGVVGTTSVLGVGTYLFFNPLYSAHCLKVKWNSFYKSISRVLIATAFICLVTYIIPLRSWSDTWPGFIVCAAIIAVIALPIYALINFDFAELKALKNKIVRR